MGTPGFKSREVRIVIDNLGDYPEYYFYQITTRSLTQTERPPFAVNFKTTRFPSEGLRVIGGKKVMLLGWVLIAIPRRQIGPDGEPDWDSLVKVTPGVLRSNPAPECLGLESAPIFWPFDYEVRHLRITLTENELTLTPGPVEQCSNGFNSWLPGLLTAATVTGLGFWVARRLTRRRSSPTVPEGDR